MEGVMKQLALMVLLGVICTVNYPSDCTIVDTKMGSSDDHFKTRVECSYGENGADGRSVYYAHAKRAEGVRVTKVDYLPTLAVGTDSITMTCE